MSLPETGRAELTCGTPSSGSAHHPGQPLDAPGAGNGPVPPKEGGWGWPAASRVGTGSCQGW